MGAVASKIIEKVRCRLRCKCASEVDVGVNERPGVGEIGRDVLEAAQPVQTLGEAAVDVTVDFTNVDPIVSEMVN